MDQNINDNAAIEDDPEGLQKIFAKTNYALRESRKAVLKQYDVADEAALLDQIKAGQVDEHRAYDHYLGALIMEQTRLYIRSDLLAQFSGKSSAEAPVSVHLMLKDKLEVHYGERLSEPVRMAQDALILSFDSGLLMEVRYYSPDEYMISWSWGEAELRIDTAPVHPECKTFPHHLHGDNGIVSADSVTLPGTDCWTNFSRLLDILLVNPLLNTASPEQ